MGDAPLAYVETVGGVRVAEDDEVKVGKNDVSDLSTAANSIGSFANLSLDSFFQGWQSLDIGASTRLHATQIQDTDSSLRTHAYRFTDLPSVMPMGELTLKLSTI